MYYNSGANIGRRNAWGCVCLFSIFSLFRIDGRRHGALVLLLLWLTTSRWIFFYNSSNYTFFVIPSSSYADLLDWGLTIIIIHIPYETITIGNTTAHGLCVRNDGFHSTSTAQRSILLIFRREANTIRARRQRPRGHGTTAGQAPPFTRDSSARIGFPRTFEESDRPICWFYAKMADNCYVSQNENFICGVVEGTFDGGHDHHYRYYSYSYRRLFLPWGCIVEYSASRRYRVMRTSSIWCGCCQNLVWLT